MISLPVKFVECFKWLYLQYLLNTALYMLEPYEIRIFNSILLTMLTICFYSTYLFFPARKIVETLLILNSYGLNSNETIMYQQHQPFKYSIGDIDV